MIWTPRTTVAAVIEQDQQFLMVEEYIGKVLTLSQPAGHLEAEESLIDAVIRETYEETAYHFTPTALIGIYRWQGKQDTYIRYCFTGDIIRHDPHQSLDPDIHQAIWLDKASIESRQHCYRSPLVGQCLQHYLAGRRYPLSLLVN